MAAITKTLGVLCISVLALAASTSSIAVASSANAPACTNKVANDFNGDGIADLAIADRQNGITIAYGTAIGEIGIEGAVRFTGEQVYPGHNAGLAARASSGHFNGDCYADLAFTVYWDPADPIYLSAVVYGDVDGIDPTSNSVVFETGGANDGSSQAVSGDFNGDGYDDLASSRYGHLNHGSVVVRYGSDSGLDAEGTYWSQATPGVPGTDEMNDRFGSALAAGDINGDGYADLAIGNPGESLGNTLHAGMVTILNGSATGLTATGAKSWHQNTTGVPGTAEVGDYFGAALGMGDFDGDGYIDLAINSPGESLGTTTNAGTITILNGSATGLTAAGAKSWHQNTAGVPGIAETDDHFGAVLLALPALGTDRFYLAVGTPLEDTSGHNTDGVITIIPSVAEGLTSTGSTNLSGASFPWGAQDNAWFGYDLG